MGCGATRCHPNKVGPIESCKDPITINCEAVIDTKDVHQLKIRTADKSLDTFFDEIFKVVSDASNFDLKNAEFTCITPNQHITMWAGDRINKYVIRMNTSGEITTVVEKGSSEPVIKNCGKEITTEDIHLLKSEVDQRYADFFNAAEKLVSENESWIFEDAEVVIVLPNIHFRLYAGQKTHQYAIFENADGKVEISQRKCGRYLYYKQTVKNTFEWIYENIPVSSILKLVW